MVANNDENPHDGQQQFPLMRLPTEIRLIVYELAFEDLARTIIALRSSIREMRHDIHTPYTFLANPNGRAMRYVSIHDRRYDKYSNPVRLKNAPLLGALGLLHTSSTVRAESMTPMLLLADKHYEAAEDVMKSVIRAYTAAESAVPVDEDVMSRLSDELMIARNHRWKFEKVKMTLDEAARSLSNSSRP